MAVTENAYMPLKAIRLLRPRGSQQTLRNNILRTRQA